MGSHAEERFGAPYLLMHRGDLHAAIALTVPNDILNLNRKTCWAEPSAGGHLQRGPLNNE
jgi:6-hydroxynicotinate 3-monooxygenase